MTITLRRFIATEEDFDIFDGQLRVGRVYRRDSLDRESWRWEIAKRIADPAVSGISNTKAEAVAALDHAYRACVAQNN